MSNTMREILFRGKRVDNGEWVEGFYVVIAGENHYIFTGRIDLTQGSVGCEYFKVDSKTVCRYTGLTDKNGVKIFEGDILKAIWQHLSNTDTVIGIVKYDDAAFILETDDHYLFFEDNIFSDECEVVGNIHDDHELLEKSNET